MECVGGAIYVTNVSVELRHCTLAENKAVGRAGVFNPFRPWDVNNGSGYGGGIYNLRGIVQIANTILARNVAITGDVYSVVSDGQGTFTNQGYNLVGTADRITGLLASDLTGVDPSLGPLQDNGGTTPTYALLEGSAAIDGGTRSGLAFDQRGLPRTLDCRDVINSAGGDGTDIGAVENQTGDPVLRFLGVTRAGTDIRVQFNSLSGKSHSVQFTADATSGSWTTFPEFLAGTVGVINYTIPNAALLPKGFYRVVEG